MVRILKRYFGLAVLGLGVQYAAAFSLLGPIGNATDSYQTAVLSYGMGGDIGAPKNLGEEYRLNLPILYYAYDRSFLDYFGSNGVVAIDQAFLILSNHLSAPNNSFSVLSSNLTEFSLESTRFNFQAQALGMYDLKSITLSLLVEELGLAEPDRWTWALRDRWLPTGATCPNYLYDVIQRNFDPVTWEPSRYVNGTLYTYRISEFCPITDQADAREVLVDPLASQFTAVAAASGFQQGSFITGLSRDDMGGLRYLLRYNNQNVESVEPDSTLISGGFTNKSVELFVETSDLGLLAQRALTNSPGALQAFYPSLGIGSNYNYLANAVTTNITVSTLPGTNGATQIVTNTGTPYPISTLDLAALLSASVTNSSAALIAMFPGLMVTSEGTNWVVVTNLTQTPYFYYPPYSSGALPSVGYTAVTNYAFGPQYVHTFGNVVTNSIFTNSIIRTITTGLSEPWGTAGVVSPTSVIVSDAKTTNLLSGDFYLLPTNLCGYVVLQTLPLNPPQVTTNFLANVSTNLTGTNITASQGVVTYFTNHSFIVEPITCFGNVTNYTTNVVRNYSYVFDNVITNHFYTNTPVTIQITNFYSCGLPGLVCSNITTTNVTLTNVVSGDFYLLPTNQCGLSIVRVAFTNTVATTNLQSVVTNSDGSVTYQSQVSFFTNYTFVINPVDCQVAGSTNNAVLRPGIDRIQFIRHDYDSLLGAFFTPATTNYQLLAIYNNQVVAQTFRRVVRTPDILFSAYDAATRGGSVARRNAAFYTGDIGANYAGAGLAGPGTLRPGFSISFNKVGTTLINSGPFFITEVAATTNFIWASYDGSTNAPIIYPSGTSIAQLENQVIMQIATTNLPNGTVGAVYTPTVLAGSGGAPPYTWTSSAGTNLIPGVVLTSGGAISGTPAAGSAGTYDVTVIMTDTGARSVSRAYQITIAP